MNKSWDDIEYRYELSGGPAAGLRLRRGGVFRHVEIVSPPAMAPWTAGLALRQGETVMLASGPTARVEIGWYTFAGESMSGLWVPPAADAGDFSPCGKEASRRVGSTAEGGEIYEIQKAHAIDQLPYTGRVIITPTGKSLGDAIRIAFRWELHDGVYTSFGIRAGDVMATTFCFDAGAAHAISLLTPTADGFAGYHAGSDAGSLLDARWVGVDR